MAIPRVPGNIPTMPQVGTSKQVTRVSVEVTSVSVSETGGASEMAKGQGVGRAFMDNVMQALNQVGLNVSPSVVAPGKGPDAAAANPKITQAFHEFMHSLFDALRQAGTALAEGSGGPGAQAVQSRYASLPAKLENLIQSLMNQDSSTNPLQAAFDKLLAALKEGDSSGASAGATLQAFLQNLLQNIQGTPESPPSGGVVSTSA